MDERVGRGRTALILVASAVTGAVAQAAYSAEPMIGFSAAVFGLMGAAVAIMPRRPSLFVFQGIAIPMPLWAWSLIMIPLLTVSAWIGQGARVAWIAHLGGFAAGLVVAMPMRAVQAPWWFAPCEERRRRRIEKLTAR